MPLSLDLNEIENAYYLYRGAQSDELNIIADRN